MAMLSILFAAQSSVAQTNTFGRQPQKLSTDN